MTWERPFDQPLRLPNAPSARTLRDAANYIRALPDSERETPECRLAIQMLIDAAEDRANAIRENGYPARLLQKRGAHPYPNASSIGRRKLRRER